MGNYAIVENFFTKEKKYSDDVDRVYTQLSDHYGVSFEIIYKGKYIFL